MPDPTVAAVTSALRRAAEAQAKVTEAARRAAAEAKTPPPPQPSRS